MAFTQEHDWFLRYAVLGLQCATFVTTLAADDLAKIENGIGIIRQHWWDGFFCPENGGVFVLENRKCDGFLLRGPAKGKRLEKKEAPGTEGKGKHNDSLEMIIERTFSCFFFKLRIIAGHGAAGAMWRQTGTSLVAANSREINSPAQLQFSWLPSSLSAPSYAKSLLN